jgi:tol-pal system protein YbgF
MLQDGDYGGAEKAFKDFSAAQIPSTCLRAMRSYWLGETYYARRDYQNAANAFAEGYKVLQEQPEGADNLLKLGITLSAMGKKQEACAMFARFNQDYPRATESAEAADRPGAPEERMRLSAARPALTTEEILGADGRRSVRSNRGPFSRSGCRAAAIRSPLCAARPGVGEGARRPRPLQPS